MSPPHRLAPIVRRELAEASSYAPAKVERALRLDANEAPEFLSVDARERLARAVGETSWQRYPDVRATELRAAIAGRMGVDPESLVIGAGSDEVIALMLSALDGTKPGARDATVVTTTPTFVMYKMSARVRGLRVVEVPLDATWDLDTASLVRAIEMTSPNVVFVATPNNPTGNLVSRDRLERVIEAAHDSLVVVDEAYVDYAPRAQHDLLSKHDNVAILRTLSKIGFAAARVGWLAAPVELAREIDKVRQPYNLPSASQRVATLALTELVGEIDAMIAAVVEERARVAAALAALPGVTVSPSDANFVWVKVPGAPGEVHTAMAKRGVLVRSFHPAGGRLAQMLRVTLGTRAENDRLLEVLASCIR